MSIRKIISIQQQQYHIIVVVVIIINDKTKTKGIPRLIRLPVSGKLTSYVYHMSQERINWNNKGTPQKLQHQKTLLYM